MLASVTCSMILKKSLSKPWNWCRQKKHSFLSDYWFMIFTNKIICLDTLGASHSTRNSGLNSTRSDRSCSIPTWAHFSRIPWQTAEGSWWSGCPKCRKLLHVEKFNKHLAFNSSLIFMRETYELFSQESMQTGQNDPHEIRNHQSTIFQEIRS